MSTKKSERNIEGFLINRVPPSGYVDSRGIRTKHSPSAYKVEVYGGIGAGASATAGAFVIGRAYTILTVGSTSFTGIGASANTIGVVFVATGVGSGSGTATSGQLFRDGAMAGYGNGYFVGWTCQFVVNNLNTSNLKWGESKVVAGYIDKMGEFSFADNFNGAAVKGDEFILTPPTGDIIVKAKQVTITTTIADLFSIDDGFVRIKEIIGRVTVAVQAQATTVFMQFDADSGAANLAITATTGDLNALGIGTLIRYTGDFSDAFMISATTGDIIEGTEMTANTIMGEGDITIDAGAVSSGEIEWTLIYESLGGRVTAS
jgi:hypothetical protein